MSVPEDEDLSITYKFHSCSIVLPERCKAGSNRILIVLTGHISRTADIIAHHMAGLRCLDLEAYTIEDGSLYIQKLIVEDEFTVYIIDACEPEIGVRFKRQFAIIEGDGHIDNLVAQVTISSRRSILSPLLPSSA